jgi:DNA topoisomerase IA
MSMLIIAEKPSISREIAAVLGANQKRDGYMGVIFSEFYLTR